MRFIGKTKEQVEQERIEQLARQIRAERNRRLAETDWMVLPDVPIDRESLQELMSYRQALRDIPEQPGFPERIFWPSLRSKNILKYLSKEDTET